MLKLFYKFNQIKAILVYKFATHSFSLDFCVAKFLCKPRMRCAVKNCGNNNNNNKKWRYFRVPQNAELREKWLLFCRRDVATKCAHICNVHFLPEDFERNMQYEMGFSSRNPTKLRRGAVPSLYWNESKEMVKMPMENLSSDLECSKFKPPLPSSVEDKSISSELEFTSFVDSEFIKKEPIDYDFTFEEPSINLKSDFVERLEAQFIKMESAAADTNMANEISNEQYILPLKTEIKRLRRALCRSRKREKKNLREISNLKKKLKKAKFHCGRLKKRLKRIK